MPLKILQMNIYRKKADIVAFIEQKKEAGVTIGFVPTMGALHDGHLNLIREASTKCDLVIASIFVNPNQFNNSEDLRLYPRDEERDFELLESVACDAVFCPTEIEIYPEPDTRIFELGILESVMEGKFRPGHFNGVVQVVTRLFDIIQPDFAFFGKKDFQQLAIIKYITEAFAYPIQIIAVDTIREPDGLAMSSRNKRLSNEQREVASEIYRILTSAKKQKEKFSIQEIEKRVIDEINAIPYMKAEYFSIVDARTLQPITTWHEKCDIIGCIAVYCGDVRLIDNICF